MAFVKEQPRKHGDIREGVWVRDVHSLNTIMAFLFPTRAQSEVNLTMDVDITELLKYLETKNGPDAPYKTTLFHCIVTMVARVLNERPIMNRFVKAGRIYQRDKITLGFTAKRQFADHSSESLILLKAEPTDTVDTISRRIVGDVKDVRERDDDTGGIDKVVDTFAKLPRLLLMFIIRVVRWLDYWGRAPKALTEGDSNFASVNLSNLGSIKCPSVYHHLNNYGTTSVMITIGTIHKTQMVDQEGNVSIRDVVDISATLDERIGDGFYFARSLKLIQYICAHPELLERPLEEESGYDYK